MRGAIHKIGIFTSVADEQGALEAPAPVRAPHSTVVPGPGTNGFPKPTAVDAGVGLVPSRAIDVSPARVKSKVRAEHS